METVESLLPGEKRCDFILSGSLLQVVWFLSWPVVIQVLLNSLVSAVDMKMVGALGNDAVAAVGITHQLIIFLYITSRGLAAGSTVLVARSYGQKNQAGLVTAAAQSMIILTAFTLTFTALGLSGGRFLLSLLGAKAEVLKMAHAYWSITAAGLLFFIGKVFLWGIFQGVGDTRTPLLLDIAANAVNIAGNYIFIFGLGRIPAFGVAGAAMGTFIAHFLTASVAFRLMMRRAFFNQPTFFDLFRYNYAKVRETLAIGVPVALQGMVQVAANSVIVALLMRTVEATHAVSGYSLGLVIFSLAFFPGAAAATASVTLVGINLGSGNMARAHESGWKCAGLGALFISVLAAAVFVFAPELIAFFIRDAAVIAMGSSLVRILAVVEPVHAVGVILSRALQGAGESRFPFQTAVIAWLGVRVPLAWLLAFGLGMQARGIWWSIAATQVLAALLIVWKYRAGFGENSKILLGRGLQEKQCRRAN